MNGIVNPIISYPDEGNGIASAEYGETLFNDWNAFIKGTYEDGDAFNAGDMTANSYLYVYTVGPIVFVRYSVAASSVETGWTVQATGLPKPPHAIYDYRTSGTSSIGRAYVRITADGDFCTYLRDTASRYATGVLVYPYSVSDEPPSSSRFYNNFYRFGGGNNNTGTNVKVWTTSLTYAEAVAAAKETSAYQQYGMFGVVQVDAAPQDQLGRVAWVDVAIYYYDQLLDTSRMLNIVRVYRRGNLISPDISDVDYYIAENYVSPGDTFCFLYPFGSKTYILSRKIMSINHGISTIADIVSLPK